MHRFFIRPEALLANGRAVLTDAGEVKHLTRVLRAEVGESVELCVGHEREYVGEIESIEAGAVFFCKVSEQNRRRESPLEIHLYQGLPKADKMEWIVQKTVELGVNAVIPVQMARCVAKISDDKDNAKKTDRLQKIADEAAKQSKRLAQVHVKPAVKLKALAEAIDAYDLFLVPYELEQSSGLKAVLEPFEAGGPLKIGVLIGPEGGIDSAEIEWLTARGAKPITLGPRILRTETAGIAALAALQYALGDLGV